MGNRKKPKFYLGKWRMIQCGNEDSGMFSYNTWDTFANESFSHLKDRQKLIDSMWEDALDDGEFRKMRRTKDNT